MSAREPQPSPACTHACRGASTPTSPTSMWMWPPTCISLRRRLAMPSVRPLQTGHCWLTSRVCHACQQAPSHVSWLASTPAITMSGPPWCLECIDGLTCTRAAAGLVNKIGADYMGLLVLGIFNAAIGRHSIRSDFQHHAMVSCCS